MPPANKFDLNKLAEDPRKHVEVTVVVKPPESKAEREFRFAAESASAKYERTRDLIILVFVLVGITAILGVCGWLAVSPHSSPEDKKWATALMASIVTLGMGYLVGKQKAAK
jgi:hypothetical protein